MKRTKTKKAAIPRPIHPFAARMAASIPWEALRRGKSSLRVLDPMAGSGTTLVVARSLGHTSIGFDTDPLAVLLSRTWCRDVTAPTTLRIAEHVYEVAKQRAVALPIRQAYPAGADKETKAFTRYWFDATNRRQLAALATSILEVQSASVRDILWCAFSRMIITKQAGASLALDVAHSRPHKVEEKTTIRPLEHFVRTVRAVLAAAPFKSADQKKTPKAVIRMGDARKLPLKPATVDVVISSPPYLNAIDYLRGHKFTLVWMGHSVGWLRQIRATNIGTEVSANARMEDPEIAAALRHMGRVQRLSLRQRKCLARFAADMDEMLGEIHRVLVPGGRAVLVVGDCTMRGEFIRNSGAVAYLGRQHGFKVGACKRRKLPPNRRYLPPPSNGDSGAKLQNRLRTEVVLHFVKEAA